MQTKTAKLAYRDGDIMVETEVTTTTTAATIDYLDILESCRIVSDQEFDPFDCDGLEHATTPARRCDHDPSEMRGYCHSDREAIVVTVDREQVATWGVYDNARANGASRQVARELEALNLRRTIDDITRCYSRGFSVWGVTVDFMGEHSSCWGYDDRNYVVHSARHDHAAEIARALEQRGFTVINKPKTAKTVYGAKWDLRRKLHSQSFVEHEPFDYSAAEREFL